MKTIVKLPRKTKKQVRKAQLILDIRSKPKELDVAEWMYYWTNYAALFYDSDNGGDKPIILNSRLKPKPFIKNETIIRK
jgi:hypothetical protein